MLQAQLEAPRTDALTPTSRPSAWRQRCVSGREAGTRPPPLLAALPPSGGGNKSSAPGNGKIRPSGARAASQLPPPPPLIPLPTRPSAKRIGGAGTAGIAARFPPCPASHPPRPPGEAPPRPAPPASFVLGR